MGKLSCKICGTVYPDSAEKCPICGGSRKNSNPVNGTEASVAIASKKAAKGGHYTKSSVKKRNQVASENVRKTVPRSTSQQVEQDKNGKGFGILLALLILLAVGIAVYIVITYVFPLIKTKDPLPSGTTEPQQVVEQTTVSPSETEGEKTIPCESLSVDKNSLVFTENGEGASISVLPSPFNTTDTVEFASLDSSIATVDSEGNVRAVGDGETDILISCGTVQIKCHIKCSFSEGEPTGETKVTESEPVDSLILNREDFTLFFKGEVFRLEAEGIDGSEITWKVNNPYIATVSDDGEVKANHKGTTTVIATYKSVTASCIVRCDFPDESESIGGIENESSGGNTGSDTPVDYIISHIDVTIYVGNSFQLSLSDRDGNEVNVTWHSNNSDIASVSGNEVTGVSSGTTTVFCSHEGKTYQCIVRVYNG